MPEIPRHESLPTPDSQSTRTALFHGSRLLKEYGSSIPHPDSERISKMRLANFACMTLWDRNLASVPMLLAAGLLEDSTQTQIVNGLANFRLNSPSSILDLDRIVAQAKNISRQGGKLIFPSENPEEPPLVGIVNPEGDQKRKIVFEPNPTYAPNIRMVYDTNLTPFQVAFAPLWLGTAPPLFGARK